MDSIRKFIESYPLYRKLQIDLLEANPLALDKLKYKSRCKDCNTDQTFQLKLYFDTKEGFFSDAKQFSLGHFRTIMYANEKNILDDYQMYEGRCQHCEKYRQHYVIRTISDKPEPLSHTVNQIEVKYFISKIGQFPPFKIQASNEMNDFLDEEDLEYYERALMNLSTNYGIGAFAYFRRITENQIKNICLRLSELDIVGSSEIRNAIKRYNSNHQMSNLIAEVYKYLPETLKQLGDNPLQLIYDQLSGGIHEYSDKECFEKASSIDTILKYIVRNLNEEKYNRKDVSNAIKVLNKS